MGQRQLASAPLTPQSLRPRLGCAIFKRFENRLLLEVISMIRQRNLSLLVFTTASLLVVAINVIDRPASSASQPAAKSDGDKDAASQIKDLQKQVAELQRQ